MSFPTWSQVLAIGRHVATAAGVAATVLGATHLADASQLTEGIGKVGDGLAQIAVSLGPIVSLVSAWFAARSASPVAQIAAVNSGDNGVKVVPALGPGTQVDAPLK